MKGILGFLSARARGPGAMIKRTMGRPSVGDGAEISSNQDAEHG